MGWDSRCCRFAGCWDFCYVLLLSSLLVLLSFLFLLELCLVLDADPLDFVISVVTSRGPPFQHWPLGVCVGACLRAT